MNKKIIVLFGMIFLIGILNFGILTASFGTFKQGQEIDLLQTCASCTYNNITRIVNPDGTQILGNTPMVRDGSVYDYTLNSSLTQTLGKYRVHGIGDLNGIDEVWVYGFEITPTGSDEMSLALVFVIFSGMLLFGFLGWFFRRDMFLHILFIFTSMLMLLYAVNQLHIPMLFFTSIVVVVLAFAYYIINYIREMIRSMNQSRGFEF